MALKLITAPAEEPITLAQAKAQCRVDGSDEDDLITALIIAARDLAENQTGRAIITQTWELALDAFPDAEITLEKPQVQSITSIKYIDSAGAEQTIDAADYALDNYGTQAAYAIPAQGIQWPTAIDAANAVKVRFVSGYGLAVSVPQSIKQWMLLHVGSWYANREAVGDKRDPLPFIDGLIDPYRIVI